MFAISCHALLLSPEVIDVEKNKLALQIWKLKYEMSLQGIDVQIPVLVDTIT
jgi:hypothetical protein